MLTDSKVRQAGFIRNSSSRKIIYQPQPQQENQSSDDSFSSFQYQNNSKVSLKSNDKPLRINNSKQKSNNSKEKINNSKQKNNNSLHKIINKPPTPQIPKPVKKLQEKPQFQNQRLKNNFFQQLSNPKHQNIQQLKHQIPRMNTPQFNDDFFKKDIEEVNNICNRIGNMKLEGNFSFNPKMNKLKTKNIELQQKLQFQNEQISNKNQEFMRSKNRQEILQKPKPTKQNNYFNTNQTNKFQYDFESSQSDQQDSENSQSSHHEYEDQQSQAIQYYQQQQRKKYLPEIAKTQPKIYTTQKSSKAKFHHQLQSRQHQIQHKTYLNKMNSRKVQNQESESNDQELITDYNKNDFAMKITDQFRNKKYKLAQNRAYNNMPDDFQHQGIIATHGGVCFDVDVKQFSQNQSQVNVIPPTKKAYQQQKKKKTNQKEQILKRRQMAKIYSKQSRFRIFGFS